MIVNITITKQTATGAPDCKDMFICQLATKRNATFYSDMSSVLIFLWLGERKGKQSTDKSVFHSDLIGCQSHGHSMYRMLGFI